MDNFNYSFPYGLADLNKTPDKKPNLEPNEPNEPSDPNIIIDREDKLKKKRMSEKDRHVLEQMGDTELSPEPHVQFDRGSLLRFLQSQRERVMDEFHSRVDEQDKKLKVQEEAIKNLQMRVDKQDGEVKTVGDASLELQDTVYEIFSLLWDEVCDMKSKMEDQERKLKDQKRKLKVHESCVRKRYNTKSGKN